MLEGGRVAYILQLVVAHQRQAALDAGCIDRHHAQDIATVRIAVVEQDRVLRDRVEVLACGEPAEQVADRHRRIVGALDGDRQDRG